MNIYQKINPKWNINLISVEDPLNIKNQDFLEMISIVRNEKEDNTGFKEFLRKKCSMKSNYYRVLRDTRKVTLISDLFRVFIINKYGGVYIDNDTFPVNPFDEDFLDLYKFNHVIPRMDNYFILGKQNFLNFRYKEIDFPISSKSSLFNDLKKKFFNCTLNYGESCFDKNTKFYYFDHYLEGTWKRIERSSLEERERWFKLFEFEKFYDT